MHIPPPRKKAKRKHAQLGPVLIDTILETYRRLRPRPHLALPGTALVAKPLWKDADADRIREAALNRAE